MSASDFVFVLLITFSIYSNHVFTLDSPIGSVYKKKMLIDHPVEKDFVLRGAINAPIDIPPNINTDKITSKSGNRPMLSEYALEGGGIPQRTSTTLSNNEPVESEIGEEIHSKGSKGRKGVGHPGSSVVPSKGVDVLEGLPLNNSLSGNIPLQETIKSSSFSSQNKSSSNLTGIEHKKNFTTQPISPLDNITEEIIHAKKPEVVSDDGDVDDFDSYSIIKTSTTGEDYVIVGIAIVIGIWFSVFGALIFYRRAGEYWDRRHYRRMDFLVEGMYND